MENITDIHYVVREVLFDNIDPEWGLCFSYSTPVDASANQRGDLFEQNADFRLVEVEVDRVIKAGPGTTTPTRVYGGVDLSLQTKDRLDDIGANAALEEAGYWLAQKTIQRVRFREFSPTGDGRDRGFQFFSGVVPFEFEIPQKP